MSNLSELSKQLRKLQSKNNDQANEIDRLERQIRILSDLKGISIHDLQDALSAACEDEAHGELRSIVGKLQARIDGMELGGGGVGGNRNRGDAEDANDNIPTQEQFDKEAAARARTTLELRIGELEELETTFRSELDSLYRNSQGLTERNTFLETQLLQQKSQLDQWERRWKAKEDEGMKRSGIVPIATPSTGSYNYSEFATNNDASASQSVLLHNAPQSQIDVEHEQRMLAAETSLAGEKHQRSLVQSQLSSAQKSYGLKIDQYEHRIQFLEEQLHDLEQQLSSLYAAFGIMQNDNKEERSEKEALKRTMLENDAAMAKEETERERKQQFSPNGSNAGQISTPKSERSSRHSLTKFLSPPASLPKAAVKPAAHPPIAKGLLSLLLDKDGQAMPSIPTPSTPRPKAFSARKLLQKSSSSRKHSASSAAGLKFKKQYCVLHGANGLYQIRYGDSYTGSVSGVHEFITAGVSSIDHTPRSSSQPYGFEIMINANYPDAPVLCCVAESEEDFMMWMSALTSVIDGSIDNQHETALAVPTEEAFTLGVSPAQNRRSL
mmetsp:Transcript_15799/g.34198  ORF Transcript_15799/g.34198 Transcript_15799/m.34198 type:complete len:553 (-) Transcript_15799:119-1777(-)|eukprot:CAMPEP_0172305990 /NCGR_PEP_ID=MMETSP1058-20130122/7166_1 /TAXON_ID=83371 /ORGANISM="Detonula confervacea, Strain CCMP 353" /LENGTH=552 /DNA_ID=CAMNT_0013017757 /DNA_START=106 /DNA_END=1764 /DNA_ORIENTATION=-